MKRRKKKLSFEWPCRLEGSIFSPSLLKILDMQMGVTVIPCHSLAGWLAVPTHSLLPVLCINSLSVAVTKRESVLYPQRWTKKMKLPPISEYEFDNRDARVSFKEGGRKSFKCTGPFLERLSGSGMAEESVWWHYVGNLMTGRCLDPRVLMFL